MGSICVKARAVCASGIPVGAGGGSSCDEGGRGDDEVVQFGFSLESAPGAVAFLSAESLPVCGAPTWWLVTLWDFVPIGSIRWILLRPSLPSH